MTGDRIIVLDNLREVTFTFEDMLRYHGTSAPAGVAHAFKVLERALPLLNPAGHVERREITIDTPFGGPGARDAFELVTRAVTEGRFFVDPSLARPDHGRARERFVFRLRFRERVVTLTLRGGFVSEEFIDLTRREQRSADEEEQLTKMKADMARRLMSMAATEVYDVSELDPLPPSPHD